jgi:four helix bundle protein
VAGAKTFQELACWQLAYELKLRVYRLARRPSVRRDLKLHAQLIETSRSAPRNIAEGFARRSHADFARFLDIARGSLMELQNHIIDATDCRYCTERERDEMLTLARRAGAATAALQRYLRGNDPSSPAP